MHATWFHSARHHASFANTRMWAPGEPVTEARSRVFFTHSRLGRVGDACACNDSTLDRFAVRATVCISAHAPRLLALVLTKPAAKAAGAGKADTLPAQTIQTMVARLHTIPRLAPITAIR